MIYDIIQDQANKIQGLNEWGLYPPVSDSDNASHRLFLATCYATRIKGTNKEARAITEQLAEALQLFLDQYYIPGDDNRLARPEIAAALAALENYRSYPGVE